MDTDKSITYNPNSNLSEPDYGYDLVVATTQKSINTVMTEFLDRTNFKEVICYFVRGAHKHDPWQPITGEELKRLTNNTDPFGVSDTVNDGPSINNLRDAKFKAAFRAVIGLPDKTTNPPVVTLGQDSNAPVTFNLLCSEFQITGFDGDDDWTNIKQPTSGNPWYFSAQVQLHSTTIDHKSSKLPAAVTQEVQKKQQLNAGTFSLQQMFLNLDTAKDFSTLTFKGLDKNDPIAFLVNGAFCQAYLDQMKQTGHPVLGYSFIMDNPDASSFELGALTMESCPLLDSSNNPYVQPNQSQQDAATFNYLCTTTKTPPTANRFKWNWVDVNDLATVDGVMVLRRDLFLNVLESTLTKVMENNFCYTANIDFKPEGESFVWEPTFGTGGKAQVVRTRPGIPIQRGNFTHFLEFKYSFDKTAQSPVRYWSSFNVHFYLWVAYNSYFHALANLLFKDNEFFVRLELHSRLQAEYGHYEGAVWYDNFPKKDYIDYRATIDLPLRILGQGQITFDTRVKPYSVKSNNAPYAVQTRGTLGMGTNTIDFLDRSIRNHILDPQRKTIIDCVNNLAQEVADALQGHKGWVFPGGKYFNFQDVGCSDYLDLIAYIKYADISPH